MCSLTPEPAIDYILVESVVLCAGRLVFLSWLTSEDRIARAFQKYKINKFIKEVIVYCKSLYSGKDCLAFICRYT